MSGWVFVLTGSPGRLVQAAGVCRVDRTERRKEAGNC